MSSEGPLPRRPLGNVLVATDFSSGAERAVARALRLPVSPGSTLFLIHVVSASADRPVVHAEKALLSRRLEEARSWAATLAGRLGRAPLAIVPAIAEGRPFDEIARAARQRGAELIVLGRHGKSSFRAVQPGSTAERVIRKASASVLVVSQPAEGAYRRPLVAVDFSATSRFAVEFALRLTEPANGIIDVVHAHGGREDELPLDFVADDYEQEARRRLEEFLVAFEGAGVGWNTLIERGDARQVILDAAAARGCDLIVLGTHGRSPREEFLVGSVAEAVVRAAASDVLAVRLPPSASAWGR